jgi:hypothetical protein
MTIQTLRSPSSWQSPGIGYQPPKPPGTFWEKSGRTIGTAIGSGMTTGGLATLPALTVSSAAPAFAGAASLAAGAAGPMAGIAAGTAVTAGMGAAVPTAAVLGTPLGPLGVAAIGIAGAIVGSLLDELFGDKKQEAPGYTPPKPTFKPGTSPPPSSGGLGDPGSSPGAGQSANIRLGAAKNIQNSLSG